jgi:hypothetical protein
VGLERLSDLTKSLGDGRQRLLHFQRSVVPLLPRRAIRIACGSLLCAQHLLSFGVELAQTRL